ncbi:MAG: glycosyl transferase [Rhizobiales bacterium]|nr:glycosyl transferase [Hyphomicrobiales bacterium]
MSISVLFYVQHLLGVGHLARASLVAQALVAQGATVTLVTGGRPVDGFPGPGPDVVELPSVSAGPGGFGDLIDERGNPVDDALKHDRSKKLINTLHSCEPDVILIEAFPFGRRQMRFELLPLLAEARSRQPRALVACSVRDILQTRSAQKHQQTVDEISAAFDLVLVHADPAFARLEETFPPAGDFADKIRYTGVVSAQPGRLQDDAFDVVVSAGGGIVGEKLIRTALAAKPVSSLSAARWCIITGPNLAAPIADELAAKAGKDVSFYPSRRDFRALLANAQLSISQAGYNTAADILRAGCRSIMVPYASAGETEQTLRASKLAERGLISAIAETELTAEKLARQINERMTSGPIGTSHGIDLTGAECAAAVLLSEAGRRL